MLKLLSKFQLKPLCQQVREHLRHLTLDAQTEASREGRAAVAKRERSQRQLDEYSKVGYSEADVL